MTERVKCQRLEVAANLKRFIEEEALPGSGVDAAAFWSGFDALVHELAPKNAAMLAERDRIQAELDAWHRANPGPIADFDDVKKSDGAAFNRWFHGLLKRGVFIAPAAFEAMFVSTAHTREDVAATLAAAKQVASELARTV